MNPLVIDCKEGTLLLSEFTLALIKYMYAIEQVLEIHVDPDYNFNFLLH